jgi:CelD/BcsL family acetyltransferase involved in cellulose biosynthesis
MKAHTSTTHPPQITILKETRQFANLEDEWQELYHNAPLATPFQSWEWLYSWWEFYGEGYQLRLITVRSEGLLVGILPLMLKRKRWGFERLLFLGTGITDYLDVVAREGWEEYVAEAGGQALWRMGLRGVIELHELRPEAVAWGIFERWSGPKTRIHLNGFDCPVIEVRPWDELLGSLSKNLRSTVRRNVRRAAKEELRCELVGAADAGRAARDLMRLHREGWQGRDISPENLTRRFEAHLEAAARRMMTREVGSISELRRGEEVVLSVFWIFGRDFVGFYMLGANQETLRRYQVSSLFIRDGLELARERDATYLDLLRGEEPYKLRWTSRMVANHRVILGRNPLFWSPYVGYRLLRSRARRYLEQENTPSWVKSTLNRFRQRYSGLP